MTYTIDEEIMDYAQMNRMRKLLVVELVLIPEHTNIARKICLLEYTTSKVLDYEQEYEDSYNEEWIEAVDETNSEAFLDELICGVIGYDSEHHLNSVKPVIEKVLQLTVKWANSYTNLEQMIKELEELLPTHDFA